jgi:hypothetical protein
MTDGKKRENMSKGLLRERRKSKDGFEDGGGPMQDLQKERAPRRFTLKYTVNFKDVFQVPKFPGQFQRFFTNTYM